MFRSHLLRRVERMVGTIGYFVSSESIFIVLNDFANEEIHDLAKRLEEQEGFDTVTLKIAVSQNEPGIEHLSENYKKVCTLLRLARKRGESPLFMMNLVRKRFCCPWEIMKFWRVIITRRLVHWNVMTGKMTHSIWNSCAAILSWTAACRHWQMRCTCTETPLITSK